MLVSMAFIFYYVNYNLNVLLVLVIYYHFALTELLYNLYFTIVFILLLLETGVIERNPGPNNINNSLSTLHRNIRGIRNKLDNITENLLECDVLRFTS